MKRSQAFYSPRRFLAKADIRGPFTAIIARVVLERVTAKNCETDKPVLHFAGNQIKAPVEPKAAAKEVTIRKNSDGSLTGEVKQCEEVKPSE
jgi:hypothetical protein